MSRSTERQGYEIRAQWDSEAGVWVAESDDVQGLVAEADSADALARKLRSLLPELLELNGVHGGESLRFHVLHQHEDREALCRLGSASSPMKKLPLKPKKSGCGLLAKYGPGPSEEEIDENRREMFKGFAEDFE